MPCERFPIEGGGVAIICSRGRCAFPLPGGRACGRELCEDHGEQHGPDLVLCPQHARAPCTEAPPPGPPGRGRPCKPGDGAAALAALEQALSPKDEIAGVWTRRRSDCFDTEAVDPVLAQDEAFRPRDYAEWAEYVTERAAIFEYLGGRPRQVAEALARQLAGPAPRHARSGPLFAGAR